MLATERSGGAGGGGNGLLVCVQEYCRVVAKVAPPWVAHVEWRGGAPRSLGADFVGAREGGSRPGDPLGPLAFGRGGKCRGGSPGRRGATGDRRQATDPSHLQSLPKRRRMEPQWEALGLEEMSSDEEEALDSGASSTEALVCSSLQVSRSGGSGSGVGTEVSDTQRDSLSSSSSAFSTDVSDRASAEGGVFRDNQEWK